ncbi:anti-sigma factor antagonist [Streptomyces geranii]|uniref:anti-sigma factor antagonist n=1 Tax=Streptomyces geranii TaxID=2058923 RepID=UPI001E4F0947|nr:anti-sigma factor antagonist [Streptomyces geranii]
MQQDPAPPTRHLRVHEDRGHTVLEFHGEIDIAAAVEIIPHLDEATGRPDALVVIDLTGVEFFDCSGLRLLYRARHRVHAHGGRLHLVCAHPLTLRVLKVTGLAKVLPPVASLDLALETDLELPEAASGTPGTSGGTL